MPATGGKRSDRKKRWVFPVPYLTEVSFQPEQPTRPSLDHQSPISAHHDSGDGLLGRLADSSVRPTLLSFSVIP